MSCNDLNLDSHPDVTVLFIPLKNFPYFLLAPTHSRESDSILGVFFLHRFIHGNLIPFLVRFASRAQGRLGGLAEVQTITCVAFVKNLSKDPDDWKRGYAITGFQSGGVCIWKGSSAFHVVKSAHKGPVTCLAVSYPETEGGAGNGWVISGGRDGRAKVKPKSSTLHPKL